MSFKDLARLTHLSVRTKQIKNDALMTAIQTFTSHPDLFEFFKEYIAVKECDEEQFLSQRPELFSYNYILNMSDSSAKIYRGTVPRNLLISEAEAKVESLESKGISAPTVKSFYPGRFLYRLPDGTMLMSGI